MKIVSNIIGIIGVVLMLAAFFLSQRGTITIRDPRYLWMNLTGAVAVIFSLFWAWNLPAFLIESAWAVISAYGIITSKQKNL